MTCLQNVFSFLFKPVQWKLILSLLLSFAVKLGFHSFFLQQEQKREKGKKKYKFIILKEKSVVLISGRKR